MAHTTVVERTPFVLTTAPMPSTEGVAIRFIGIDVAKATISICTKDARGIVQKTVTLRNAKADITRWIEQRTVHGARVVMESTGTYHWIPALVFAEAGCDVRVCNPLLLMKYNTASIRKVKNDPADARMLCEVAEHETKLPPQFNASKKWLILRKNMNLQGSLARQIQEFTATITETERTYNELDVPLPATITALRETIKVLTKQKEALEKEFVADVVAEDPSTRTEELARLTSVPGVSRLVGALIIHAFRTDVPSVDSWGAYIGADVSVRESGKWRGRGRLTKRGNPYLRKRIFCAAWGAFMHDERFKEYYYHLRNERGKAHAEALTIISRKLLRILYMIRKEQTTFDSSLPILQTQTNT